MVVNDVRARQVGEQDDKNQHSFPKSWFCVKNLKFGAHNHKTGIKQNVNAAKKCSVSF